MEYLKSIKPYNKYWANCIVNALVSFICNIEPSYESIIYLNDYIYFNGCDGICWYYTQEYYNYFKNNIFTVEKSNFKADNTFIFELKYLIQNTPFVLINIDLFYWGHQSAFYNTIHVSHYSPIIGFDDCKHVYYALEDDIDLNYGIVEIPEDRLLKAFFSNYKNDGEDYIILSYKNNISPYTLDLVSILSKTRNLINHLDSLLNRGSILSKAEILSNMNYIFMFGTNCGKIMNRFNGNIQLFNIICENKFVKGNSLDNLISECEEIGIRWNNLKNIILKNYCQNKFPDLDMLENDIKTLIKREKEMWTEFLSVTFKIPD